MKQPVIIFSRCRLESGVGVSRQQQFVQVVTLVSVRLLE